jgi:predicted DNA-binding ribbon-helix-helix protein
MKRVYSFTLEQKNVEKLKEILEKENIPLSTFIDSLIEQFVLSKELKSYGVFSKSS